MRVSRLCSVLTAAMMAVLWLGAASASADTPPRPEPGSADFSAIQVLPQGDPTSVPLFIVEISSTERFRDFTSNLMNAEGTVSTTVRNSNCTTDCRHEYRVPKSDQFRWASFPGAPEGGIELWDDAGNPRREPFYVAQSGSGSQFIPEQWFTFDIRREHTGTAPAVTCSVGPPDRRYQLSPEQPVVSWEGATAQTKLELWYARWPLVLDGLDRPSGTLSLPLGLKYDATDLEVIAVVGQGASQRRVRVCEGSVYGGLCLIDPAKREATRLESRYQPGAGARAMAGKHRIVVSTRSPGAGRFQHRQGSVAATQQRPDPVHPVY